LTENRCVGSVNEGLQLLGHSLLLPLGDIALGDVHPLENSHTKAITPLFIVFSLLVVAFDKDKIIPITFQLSLQIPPVLAADFCLCPLF
jgi:hypothetical protein